MNRIELGAIWEEAAVKLLRRAGYRIRERNFRCALGEIDLVAEDRGVLTFVEVKTRSSAEFGLPPEAVSPVKQRRLVRLATFYLARRRLLDRACRFDVVSVILSPSGRIEHVELITDAFIPSA